MQFQDYFLGKIQVEEFTKCDRKIYSTFQLKATTNIKTNLNILYHKQVVILYILIILMMHYIVTDNNNN